MLYNLMKYIRYTIQMYHVKKSILIIYIGMCAYGVLSSFSSLQPVPIYFLYKFFYAF